MKMFKLSSHWLYFIPQPRVKQAFFVKYTRKCSTFHVPNTAALHRLAKISTFIFLLEMQEFIST